MRHSTMLRPKPALHLSFLLMGFGFTVTQGLLVRELLVAYFGNELSIGLILGNWLILEAVGSGLLGKLAGRWVRESDADGRCAVASVATLQVLFALLLPLCLYAAYASRHIVGAIPGEGIGLVPIFWSTLLILAPLALVDGAMFAFSSRAYAILIRDQVRAIGRVYVYEAAGAIAGGLVFTYLFLPLLSSLQTALLLSGLNLASAALLLLSTDPSGRSRLARALGTVLILALLSGILGFLLSPWAGEAQRWVANRQWAGYNLVYSENSVYGNVAVIQQEEQYTFYADGIPMLTAPVPNVALCEEIVHLPMLFVHQPRRALVLSGGVGGVLRELIKYPLQQIDYAELDPLLVEAVRKFPTPLTEGELGDARVKVEYVDGRLLARRKTREIALHPQERYDLVIVNLPYPSTLQLNRFYTAEFFQIAQELLAERGILVVGCPGTLTYMSDELRDLNAMVYRALQEAFPHVRPIPGDVTLWLASSSDELSTASIATLAARWEERGLETQLVTLPHIRLKLEQRRLDWFWTSLGKAGEPETKELVGARGRQVNRDLRPIGLFHGLSYWNALFSPHLAWMFAFAGRLSLWTLGPTLAGCMLLLLVISRSTGKGTAAVIPVVIATTGATGMAADLIFVFAFQTLYGYVYHWIGLLIAAFMAGLGLGGLVGTRRAARFAEARPALLKLEGALVLYWLLLPILLMVLRSGISHPLVFASTQGVLTALNALAGFLVGLQFPLANKTWMEGRGDRKGTAGALYAWDLVGAFLGAIVVSVVLIPVLGLLETCFLAAILKAGSFLLALSSRGLRRSSQ